MSGQVAGKFFPRQDRGELGLSGVIGTDEYLCSLFCTADDDTADIKALGDCVFNLGRADLQAVYFSPCHPFGL